MRIPTTPNPEMEPATELAAIDAALEELAAAAPRLVELSMDARIALLKRCADDTLRVMEEWVSLSCDAKGIPFDGPLAGEEWLNGPWCVLRYLRLLMRSLKDIQRHGKPRLPARVRKGPQGQAIAPVFPTDWRDMLLYAGITAQVWMKPQVTPETLAETMAPAYRIGPEPETGVTLVLGAGNVSSIPPLDTLSHMFCRGRTVMLKMHPVNAYLGPLLESAMRGLVEEGFLRVIYGGAAQGTHAMAHKAVKHVHITGSAETHDAIVWGAEPKARAKRRKEGKPLLNKPITSELGNVSPVIVLPGRYSPRALRFHAESVASMLANNASFNCNAAKLLLTWRAWPQREAFLEAVRGLLADAPARQAYYPGAQERHGRFAQGHSAQLIGQPEPGQLPWLLADGLPSDGESHWFREEAFCGVLGEVPLDADGPAAFLDAAVGFANERLWGTLSACLIVPPDFRRGRAGRAALDRALADLRYGSIGINLWPAMAFALMSTPWGGWQGKGITLANVQSGIGWVHNSYMLSEAQKVVVEGPFTVFPKPPWYITHKTAHALGKRLAAFEHNPSPLQLPGLLLTALRG